MEMMFDIDRWVQNKLFLEFLNENKNRLTKLTWTKLGLYGWNQFCSFSFCNSLILQAVLKKNSKSLFNLRMWNIFSMNEVHRKSRKFYLLRKIILRNFKKKSQTFPWQKQVFIFWHLIEIYRTFAFQSNNQKIFLVNQSSL